MLEVISSNALVNEETAIPLQNVTLNKGCTTTVQGTSTVVFNKSGVYLVQADAVAMSSEATGFVGIQIARNGALQGIPSINTVSNTTDIHALSTNCLIQVPADNAKCNCCSVPTSITVQNVGNEATFGLNLVVTKIC